MTIASFSRPWNPSTVPTWGDTRQIYGRYRGDIGEVEGHGTRPPCPPVGGRPISRLYLPYISRISRQYSPISRLYLPFIFRISRPYLPFISPPTSSTPPPAAAASSRSCCSASRSLSTCALYGLMTPISAPSRLYLSYILPTSRLRVVRGYDTNLRWLDPCRQQSAYVLGHLVEELGLGLGLG